MIIFNSRGSSGNIFAVLGSAVNELRSEKRFDDCKAVKEKVFSSGSYEEALAIIGSYVPLYDRGSGKHYGA